MADMTRFCAICSADEEDAADLRLSEDGFLECRRCRSEHPRQGGYSFGEGARGQTGITLDSSKRRNARRKNGET